MKKRKIILIVIGLLLALIPLFINKYSIYRLISVLVGLIILEVGLILNKKDIAWRIVLYPIILIVLFFIIDLGNAHLFKRIPVFSNRVVSSNNVITYNSLFYRELSCSGNIIVDDFYKKAYQCRANDLETIDVSSFLNNTIENYKNYHDKYVKLEGKISKINGTYNLELQPYTLTEDSINGYVLFSTNVTLEVNFNEIQDLTSYKLYDSITVIGKIDELILKGNDYIIRMNDSVILSSELYEDFEISVIPKKSCEKDLTEYANTTNKTYYTSCLDKIYVKYDSQNVYELSYILLDKKISFENLIEKSIDKKEANGNTLYIFDKFNILTCKEKEDIIIGDKNLKEDSPYCEAEGSNPADEL